MKGAFSNLDVWNWLLDQFTAVELFFSEAITTASGPIEEYAFDTFLRQRGVTPCGFSANLDVLVVGHDGWDAGELEDLVESRRGQHLKVYSQEMLLSYLLSGQDPYDEPEILPSFAEGHAALEYLLEISFPWPTTTLVPTKNPKSFSLEGSREASVLAVMGYRTGWSAPAAEGRREVLKAAFEGRLPFVESKVYMTEWGRAKSAKRLKKMADSLASTVRRQKLNKTRDLSLAIEEREADLEWLRETYYEGRFSFFWPST